MTCHFYFVLNATLYFLNLEYVYVKSLLQRPELVLMLSGELPSLARPGKCITRLQLHDGVLKGAFNGFPRRDGPGSPMNIRQNMYLFPTNKLHSY
jgi:hypothetical protein